MCRIRSSLLAAAAAPICLTLLSVSAVAGGKYEKVKDPVFLEARPDRALVYVLRIESPKALFPPSTLKIFLDETPLGYLRGRSYLASHVEPGTRLLWGPEPGTPLWVDLEAGRTYLFRLDEVWGTRVVGNTMHPVLEDSSWATDDSSAIRSVVGRWDLSFIRISPGGESKLREEARDDIGEARRMAGPPAARRSHTEPPPLPLPSTFDDVAYRPEKRGFALKAYESKGSLTVTEQAISYDSEKERLSIPLSDVRSVSSGPLGVEKTIDWAIIEYGPMETSELAGFTSRGGPSPILSTIRGALEARTLTPMRRVENAVESAEAFEAAGSMNASDLASQLNAYEFADGHRRQLAALDPLLSAHLESSPDDLAALLLQVRLDRSLRVLAPVTIVGGKVQEDPLASSRDPQATLDRILRLEPGHPLALFMKADLYGITDPLTGKPADLDKAIVYATQAVQAAPEGSRFREPLALYLVRAGRHTEAMKVLEEGHATDSPVFRLVGDRIGFPLPHGAFENRTEAEGLAQVHSARGRIRDYPLLRVWVYSVPVPVSEVDSFYRERFPGLVLREEKQERRAGGEPELRMLGSLLEWRGAELLASRKDLAKMKEPPDGVGLVLIETRNPRQEDLERLGLPTTDVVSTIIVTNFRLVGGPAVPAGR